ncbi:hypothetical protein BDW74DRAFT_181621 [Aspergillus multicolor]|uniref:uncharacterized protein n=1 Tax=Aspergillus multicolor TaxID=41759 RepID=UPI003CCD3CFF
MSFVDVARILDTARIPNLLFGWWAVGCHGIDLSFPEVDFVIPNNDIEAAASALAATGHFHRCTNPNCVEWTADRRPRDYFQAPLHQPLPLSMIAAQAKFNNYHAIAQDHLHTGRDYTYFTVISLYAQSRLLWSFPKITLDPITSDDRTFMFTNDVRLPPRTEGGSTGPWNSLYPVKILTHAALVEALLLLFCRDLGHLEHTDVAWLDMLNKVIGRTFIPGTVTLNEQMLALRRNINPRWVPVLDSSFFDPRPIGSYTNSIKRYRADLLANNELPGIPPHRSDYSHLD